MENTSKALFVNEKIIPSKIKGTCTIDVQKTDKGVH